jgi:hypothetical protein
VSPLSLGIAGFGNKINIRELQTGDKDVRKKGKENELRKERRRKWCSNPMFTPTTIAGQCHAPLFSALEGYGPI